MAGQSTRLRVATVLVMVLLLGASFTLAADGSGEPSSPPQQVSKRTVEPAPPYGLAVALRTLQKYPSGGVATLLFKPSSEIELGEVTLVADLPKNLSFADGSQSKAWVVSLNPGSQLEIPVEVLASEDGKYTVRARFSGELSGKPVRRGTAFKLLVGIEEQAPTLKNGAVEYPGVRTPTRKP